MTKRGCWIFLLGLVVMSLMGMAVLWRSTPFGMGLVNDSATYIEGASRLLEGKGFVRISGGGEVKPITHFPPMFSIFLAGLGLAGMDLLHAARVLITFLFGLDIVLVGLSVYKISRSIGFALFGALLLAISDLHLGVYSFALSEPLFLTLLLAAFLMLSHSFDHPHWSWQAGTGFLLSLAYLTRYAGISLFVTVAVVMIFMKPPQLLKRAGIMLVGSLVPILIWILYGLFSGGPATLGNRQLLWHPLPINTLFEAFKNLLTWIAPDDLLAAGAIWGRALSLVSLLIIPGLVAWLIWAIRNRARLVQQEDTSHGDFGLAFTQALHIPVYLGFMLISLTFFDASTPLNDRILSIIYIPELILVSSAMAWLWVMSRGRAAVIRWLLAVFCLLLVAFSIRDGITAVKQIGREGQGFAHRGISESPAIQAIHMLPPTLIYSNKPGAIFLLTGKSAYVTPTPTDPVTGQDRSNFNPDLLQMQQRIKDGKAILVLFGLRNSDDPGEVDLFAELTDGLTIQADYGDILLFGSYP